MYERFQRLKELVAEHVNVESMPFRHAVGDGTGRQVNREKSRAIIPLAEDFPRTVETLKKLQCMRVKPTIIINVTGDQATRPRISFSVYYQNADIERYDDTKPYGSVDEVVAWSTAHSEHAVTLGRFVPAERAIEGEHFAQPMQDEMYHRFERLEAVVRQAVDLDSLAKQSGDSPTEGNSPSSGNSIVIDLPEELDRPMEMKSQ